MKKNRIWILLIAGLILEGTACVQYFTSHAAIKKEAVARAQSELRRAELEIENHTIEMETAAKALSLIAEHYVDQPDSIYSATRLAVSAIRSETSVAVAYIPDYFPEKGRYFEICSSKMKRVTGAGLEVRGDGLQVTGDSIYTRQIGSAEHDYTEMEWFRMGLERDSCWWSEPYLDDSGSKTYVVSCSHPVKNGKGEVVAVVCVDLSLDYLESLSEYLQIYPNSYYTIRSHQGVEIVPVPDTTAGKRYYIFDEEIDATGWHMEIIIPDEVLFAELRKTGLLITLLMVIGLLVLAFMLTHAANTTKELILSTEKNRRMEGELQIAKTIQTAMLPKVFPPFMDRLDLNVYGLVDPAKEVGGDLYDFYVRHDKLFFCVGDVSGKGVPASLVMAMTRSLFRSITAHEEEASVIMRKMNRALVDQNAENMFLTLFLGVMDCKTGEIEYCNAGHNAPISIQQSAVSIQQSAVSIQPLPVIPNLPLGIDADFAYRAQRTQLAIDDLLFLYTDGLTEAENGTHEQFGEERMMSGLADERISGLVCPRGVVEKMKEKVEAFREGAEQSDDLTMLCIRYQRPALLMRNDIQQIPTLSEWIESLSLPEEIVMPINLALEEAVSNVMLYAYPGKSGQLFVECNKAVSDQPSAIRLIFTITDSGIAFDPTQQKEADITLSAEEREIGGLGIHLVKQIMDEVRYERTEDKNILTLVKTLNR